MKNLLIVDVQNDFLPGGNLEVPEGDKIISVIDKIQPEFDLIISTQDWHPKDHISFASNHKSKKPFDEINIEGEKQMLWPDHGIQGTTGAEFAADLETNKNEAIFRKGTDPLLDSYSGFFDNMHRKKLGLTDI